MEFYTTYAGGRPVRLCESTRQFAYDSLHCRYGKDTLQTAAVPLDDIPGFAGMTALEQYDAAVREIAAKAPIRICENEKISGAATLGGAISHMLPASYGGKLLEYAAFPHASTSVSHLTVDFSEVLQIDMDGIRAKAESSLAAKTEPEKKAFLESCLSCIDAMKTWHARYIDALSVRSGYEYNLRNLSQVPFAPARTFYEAVQCIWFCFSFLRLVGNWPGIGRLDVLLGHYLKSDLHSGRLTLDEAREILAHFFIKGC